jgi:hypothetical protein
MEQQKDAAIALAAEAGSLGPITQFLESWAVAVEIARLPVAAARLHYAEYAVQNLDRDDPARRAAMDEIRNLHTSARESLAGAPYPRPRSSPFTTFPLAFRGSSPTNSTARGTL